MDRASRCCVYLWQKNAGSLHVRNALGRCGVRCRGRVHERDRAGERTGDSGGNPYPRPRAVDIAADYALLGKKDNAFEWLDRADRAREGQLMYLRVDDRFESLRSDPRFTALERRLGFPP